MGEQHIFDGFIADSAYLGDQILGHQRRGGGVAHQNVLVADDDARIGVALSGVGPAVWAELGEADVFIGQITLTGKCFRHIFFLGLSLRLNENRFLRCQ